MSFIGFRAKVLAPGCAYLFRSQTRSDDDQAMNSAAVDDTKVLEVRDLDSFTRLCEALRHNDPTVVAVTTRQALFVSQVNTNRRLQQLGLSLKDNAVVSRICICQWNFEADEAGTIFNQALPPFASFIGRSSSLQAVVLYGELSSTRLAERLVQCILDAMVKNPSVQSFDAVSFVPLNLLASFLSSKSGGLRRLGVKINNRAGQGEAADDVEAAARAIGQHLTLEDISLETSAAGIATVPFLRSLRSHPTMRRFALSCNSNYPPEISLLPGVYESCKKLQEVALFGFIIGSETWQLVSRGLQANPCISCLTLMACLFPTVEASGLFLEHMASNDSSQQHVRKLCLKSCIWRGEDDAASKVAHMLSVSLLQHISFNAATLADMGRFFGILSAGRASTASLRSLELSMMRSPVFEHLSAYLSTTVRLRRLKVDIIFGVGEGPMVVPVPQAFLSAMRGNGSLYSVQISDWRGKAPSKRAKRIIRACTARNRALPKVLSTLFETDKSKPNGAMGSTRLSHQFPSLCLSAVQAPQMSPKNVMIGLLASIDAVGLKGNDGKRCTC